MAERLLKVKGTQLYYQDYSEVEHLLTGSVVDGTFDGNLKVKGIYLHYMDNDGVQRRLLGILTGEALAAGRIKNRGDYLYYGDYNDDERCLALRKPTTQVKVFIGTSVGGQGILNQGMITRTPNGDLYASCGDMGQNLDLDPSTGHPIEIWYSDDDGATWVVSKTIYVDDFHFGGGGNGVCIASDSEGCVHVAFAARRYVGTGGVYSRNIVFYLHGKHGDWGNTYNIFQVDHATVLDCLPKVTSLAVDSNDLAHLLFSLRGSGEEYWLYHLWDPGTGTFSNTIIADDVHGTLGGRNRLVIDGDDTVSVVYGDVSEQKYYYKQKPSGGGWSASEWLEMGGWYAEQAIAVDKENTKHIAIFEDGKGYYRQRSSAGVWSDIEEFIGTSYASPSISILPDGTVYIVAHKTYTSLIIRKRDPSTGTWSTEELWDGETAAGWGVCMLHSYHPIVADQHVCMFDAGWAFHWRPGHDDSWYWADP